MIRIKTKIFLITIIAASGIAAILGFKLYLKNKIEPNIILITFDALRADRLGCYGYPENTSPFLDSLSKKSLTFTNCIVQSGSTVPAISSLFTSRFPYLDGVVTEDYTLGERYITIAEFLKEKDYNTFAIPGHYYVKSKFGFSRGFDYFDDDYIKYLNADEISARVIDLFKKKNMENKFFLWIHIREPHSPYAPPEEYIVRSSEPTVTKIQKEAEYEFRGRTKVFTDREIYELISRYDGNIRYADSGLKKIFDHLAKMKILKKSVVIITADHGESLGEHNIFDHNLLYYGVLHVPLIIKIPGYRGKTIDYPVSSIDVFPTVLDILGYRNSISELNLRGKSLLEERDDTHIQFSEYPNLYSIIKGNWKLYVDFSNNTKMLFDIASDPQEEQDLIGKHGDIYRSLFNDLQNILRTATKKDATTSINKKAILNEEDIEHLKSLGYIN